MTPAPIGSLKSLCLQTPLVVDGEPACSILVPDDALYVRLGQQVAEAIKNALGAETRVCTDASDVDPARESVIALGQMLNNRIIERLYWNHYVYIDSACPGRDGFVVQSVHNPYPWTSGHNIIVLGGSTLDGVRRAVERFAQMLPVARQTGGLGYLMEVELPPPGERASGYLVGNNKMYTSVLLPAHDLTEAETQALETLAPKASLVAFTEFARKYSVTGEAPYLRAAKRELSAVALAYARDPKRPPPWAEETNAFTIFTAWDAIEEAPEFTDEQRMLYTNVMLHFLHSLVGQVHGYATVEDCSILHNHQTFPLLGLYGGGRYFNRYYDYPGTDVFLQKASTAFANQAKSWKPLCDADFYLTLTIGHTIAYGLAEDNLDFFESGNIRRYADYLIGICDNRGWRPGFGDSNISRDIDIPDLNLPWAFWHTRDPKYLGYLNFIHDGQWLNPFHQDVAPAVPSDLVGVHVYPMSARVYDHNEPLGPGGIYPEDTAAPEPVPYERTFDKLSFRAGFDTQAQYLLLDGYGRGAHRHYDTNAIIKLVDKGIDWLVDGDYLVRATTEHTMVSVLRDGRAPSPVPPYAELVHVTDLPSWGMTETVVRGYNGVDWYRDILWRKGDWIVMLDRMTASEAGDYKFDCVFKCIDLGNEELVDPHRFRVSRTSGFGATSGQHSFFICNGDGAAQSVVSRRGSSGPVKRLFQRHSAELAPGESVNFENLLYIDSAPRAKGYSLRSLGGGAVLADVHRPTLVGAGDFASGSLEVRAGLFCISAERVALGHGTSISAGRTLLRASTPISLELDLRTSRGTVVAERVTELLVAGFEQPLRIEPGRHEITDARIAALAPELSAALETLPAAPPGQDAGPAAPGPAAARSLRKLWAVGGEKQAPPVRDIAVADPGGDAGRLLLVCRGSKLEAYSADGARVWSFAAHGDLHCVAVADFDGDGRQEIVCGGEDRKLRLLNTDGVQQAERLTEQVLDVGNGRITPLFANCLAVSDLKGDGQIRLLVGFGGGAESQVVAYDGDLQMLWSAGPVYHSAGRLGAADLDGDGLNEVLVSDHYASVHIISADGKYVVRTLSDMTKTCFDVGDINGDGKLELLNGCDGGVLKALAYPARELFRFSNYGYGVRDVRAVDIDGDGQVEVVVASDSGYIYVLDGSGRVTRQFDLGSDVLAMAIRGISGVGRGERGLQVLAGQRDGSVRLLDAMGTQIGEHGMGAAIMRLGCFDLLGDGREQIVAVDAANNLVVLGCE